MHSEKQKPWIDLLAEGQKVLNFLMVTRLDLQTKPQMDALVRLASSSDPKDSFLFAVEAKNQSTPLAIKTAVLQAKDAAKSGEYPLIVVPYLSEEQILHLETQQVSGIDWCGNGLIIVPNQWRISAMGYPKRHREPKALNNPYAGRSALVAHMLLAQPRWESFGALVKTIQNTGSRISKAQVSKVISALEQEMIVFKAGDAIVLKDPALLLRNLGRARKPARVRGRMHLRLPQDLNWAKALGENRPELKWVVTGESSVRRHGGLVEGGPIKIAVSSLERAAHMLPGTPERIPNFATLELIETGDEVLFFKPEYDEKGIHWASLIQTWLELQAGDARQKDAAEGLRQRILESKELTNARW